MLRLSLSLIFFDDLGKTFITGLQFTCSPQVDIILFYLGYDVFKNYTVYVKSVFCPLDISQDWGSLEQDVKLNSSCHL